MRLSATQAESIRQLVRQGWGESCRVRVFGSRLDDAGRGGDLDLLLEFPDPVENPALIAAQVAARASRVMMGRKVDVLLSAPNLASLPIHEIAYREGVLL